jgi:hypothetical protein
VKKNLVMVALLLPILALAGTITQTIAFSPGEVTFTPVSGYEVPDLRGYVSTSEPGAPIIPQAILTFVVPANATVTGVDVIASEQTVLPGLHSIYPAQTPRPLSAAAPVAQVLPDPAVYSQTAPFPGKVTDFDYTGTKSGYRLCAVDVYPIQYTPATGEVALYTSLTLRVTYSENSFAATPMTANQAEAAAAEIRSFVANGSDLKRFAPPVRRSDVTDAEYVIITGDSYVSTLQPLADWHARKGYTSVIKTVSWITSNYTGYDTQQKIRNFIIDYWQNHGTMFVLLAGANTVIPCRRGYVDVSGTTDNIPVDLYYADLQYSWDGDGDHIWGEAGDDTVDFYADVYVGRAPINSTATAQTLVNKVFGYEKAPNTACIKKAYLPWVSLFTGYTGQAVSDTIANITPSGWTDTEVNSPSTSAFQTAINSGYGYCHAAAHGDDYGFYTDLGSPIYTTSEASAQTNGMSKLVIMNSMACISGNFENQSCLSVVLQNNANGGSVANMLNSRYGWGTPPSMGPSEKLCVRFYDFFITRDTWLLGPAHSRSRDVYASLGRSQSLWRWCLYEYNLMGDPGMPVWSDVPATLVIGAADSIPTGTQTVTVNVTSGSTPVPNAWVGLYKAGEVCSRGRTDGSGNVFLTVNPTTIGWLYVTAYGQDKLPTQDSIRVRTGTPQPYIAVSGTYVDNASHQLEPGQTADVYVTIRNSGSAAATGTAGTLRTSSGYATLGDSTSSYGTVAAGDTSRGDRFQVTAGAGTPPGTVIQFTLHVTSSEGNWDPTFTLTVGTPPVPGTLTADLDTGYCKLTLCALGSLGFDAPATDAGNGFCYPKAGSSQLYYSSFLVGNGANYIADRYYGNPASSGENTDFAIVDSLRPVTPVYADQQYRTVFSDAGHATPKSLKVTLNGYMCAGSAYDDFAVLVYDVKNEGASALTAMYAGVMADFDIGSDATQNTAVSNDTKRFSYMRQASSANPCVGVKILDPHSFANLVAVDHDVYVYPDSCMTDGQKFRLMNGTVVNRNSTRTYDWSVGTSVGPFDLAAGATYRCAFAFVGGTSAAIFETNADSAQSWYDRTMGVSEADGRTGTRSTSAIAANPNPFSRSVRLSFTVPAAGRVRAEVFDVSGRSVATLTDNDMVAGTFETDWTPGQLAGGVYLLKVTLPDGTRTQKLMLVR